MIVAALLPLSLRDALVRLPNLASRLDANVAESEKLQIQLFRDTLRANAMVRPRMNR
jgi:hypothetical protein